MYIGFVPEQSFRFVVESYFDKELSQQASEYHVSATYKFYYVSDGKCKIVLGAVKDCPVKREELKAGDLILIDAGTPLRLEIDKNSCRLMLLELRAVKPRPESVDSGVILNYCPDISKEILRKHYVIVNDLEHSRRNISRIHELLNTNRARYLDHVFTQTLINGLLLNMEENYSKTHVDNIHLNKIIDYIIRHFHEPISLSDIAENVGLNLSYMQSFFRKHMGNTVYDYLTEYRIHKAIALIKNTEMTFEDIAYEVGFNTRQSFYNAFHKITSYTPKLFRKYLTYPTVDFINDKTIDE